MTTTGGGGGRRKPTATSNFGVGRRESHDASAFYARFSKPEISDDDEIAPHLVRDTMWHGAAQVMQPDQIADKSVALVVTSPPYFAGKEYEEALGEGHIPASYDEYLQMLFDVFEQCKHKLEPGGRIAVNVANLGRKPYRSLSADVIDILEQLGFLLRGEIIWRKQLGASGSTAWGTYQRPGNPVLRDITERVVVASKGRFDRAKSAKERANPAEPDGDWPPHQGTMFMDDFVDATLDLWDIPAESATRVGHPAPFPVELPKRLIELYTYRHDLVLDPFMGAGSTAVAAVRTERYYVGYDTDADYLARAEERVAEERARVERNAHAQHRVIVVPRSLATEDAADDFQARAVRQGRKAKELALWLLQECGFIEIEEDVPYKELGVEVNFRARDQLGNTWLFDVSGAFSSSRPGLKRTDTLWKALGKASVLHEAKHESPIAVGPLVLLSTDLPAPNSAGGRALKLATGKNKPVYAYFELRDAADALQAFAANGPAGE